MSIQPSAIITHQTHILRQLGVVHWVQTGTPTMPIGRYFDRFCTADDLAMAVADNAPNRQSDDDGNVDLTAKRSELTHDLADDSPLHHDGVLINHDSQKTVTTATPATNEPLNPIKTPNDSPNDAAAKSVQKYKADMAAPIVRYELEGLRVGEWVLIVDVAGLGRDEQSVWVSLKSALSNWASQNEKLFSTHRIGYPMNDELNHSQALAQRCLDGFVMRLRMMDKFAPKVAFLGELPDGVDYFDETVSLPTLLQMSHDANHKRQLWQQITA